MPRTKIHPAAEAPPITKKADSMGEIHRRIDTARDVLVGKVPDPKSQVEQITLALIYKFMGDMDDEAVGMGGKPTFFTGKNAEFAWKNLFDPRLGGADMLKLYEKAIESFSLNEKFPELFRNIFKNAYLPYRDPETLKLFLKTINGFQYDHSERLGDAFEYLLSVLGSQGDAGQFRTPRHIIDFIVQVVNPGKDDKILDPACGTAGFLISAFKHVINPHTFEHASKSGDVTKVLRLTTQERAQLMHNIRGYDISPDMVRLSLVNLYLHGFKAPEILEYDTLTSDERWNEYYDVILANPPFMSPKGGIKPHKRFSVQSNRSEVLFVDYIAEHLKPTGRAGIIVPEGIIFQSGTAYKALRKMLVEKYLWAVVSLPAGVFNPYSGVKTSILFLDRARAEKSDSILFVKVQADGFDLGAQRRANGKDDLPAALQVLANSNPPKADSDLQYLIVPKAQLEASGDYNLSIDRYQPSKQQHSGKWPMVKLGDVCEFIDYRGKTPTKSKAGIRLITAKNVKKGYIDLEPEEFLSQTEFVQWSTRGAIKKHDVFITTEAPLGNAAINEFSETIALAQRIIALRPKPELDNYFLLYAILSEDFQAALDRGRSGTTVYGIKSSVLETLSLPLPPLEVQREIVAEIEGYRRVLDGAKQVVENWQPNVEFFLRKYAQGEPWEMVNIEEIVSGEKNALKAGPFGSSLKKDSYVASGYKIYGQEQVIRGDASYGDYYIDEKKYRELESCKVQADDVLISLVGTYGKTLIVPKKFEPGIINPRLLKLTLNQNKILPIYFVSIFNDNSIMSQVVQMSYGGTMDILSLKVLRNLKLPLPPLDVQQAIVAEIEKERSLVEASRQLAAAMEAKIKAVVARVWAG